MTHFPHSQLVFCCCRMKFAVNRAAGTAMHLSVKKKNSSREKPAYPSGPFARFFLSTTDRELHNSDKDNSLFESQLCHLALNISETFSVRPMQTLVLHASNNAFSALAFHGELPRWWGLAYIPDSNINVSLIENNTIFEQLQIRRRSKLNLGQKNYSR